MLPERPRSPYHPLINDDEYGIAFRKVDVDLKYAVDKAFDELVSEGKIAPIVAKYFGESNGFKR